MRKPSIPSLRRKLDKVFSEFIRKRDANAQGMGRCITCNRSALLEAGHFIPRQHRATRWNERNCHGQCSYCNRWQHGAQAEYYLALVKKYGQPTVDSLMRMKHQTVKFTRSDLQAMIEKFSQRCGALRLAR